MASRTLPATGGRKQTRGRSLISHLGIGLIGAACLLPRHESHLTGETRTLGSAASVDVSIESSGSEKASAEGTAPLPRILTVLTTYNQRTPFIKAYREVLDERGDGYEAMVFVTSDVEDEDPDGVIDYKYGTPEHHRLLAALSEAYRRYAGQFDWVAVGDDDTVFMYNRALTLLRDVDHTQPVAFARVDGLSWEDGKPEQDVECLTPEEKDDTNNEHAAKGCCVDFTHTCTVPEHPTFDGFFAYGPSGLYWPYGGSGAYISAGLMEKIAEADGGGWDRCVPIFGHGNTDCQLGMCMAAHGLTWSSYNVGFHKSHTADPAMIEDDLTNDCQVLGIHFGIRHLKHGEEYTPELFKAACGAARDMDERWVEHTQEYLAEGCPAAWSALSQWLE